ncbi:hypothetical protein D3C75_1040160 [compost metagenome]
MEPGTHEARELQLWSIPACPGGRADVIPLKSGLKALFGAALCAHGRASGKMGGTTVMIAVPVSGYGQGRLFGFSIIPKECLNA